MCNSLLCPLLLLACLLLGEYAELNKLFAGNIWEILDVRSANSKLGNSMHRSFAILLPESCMPVRFIRPLRADIYSLITFGVFLAVAGGRSMHAVAVPRLLHIRS